MIGGNERIPWPRRRRARGGRAATGGAWLALSLMSSAAAGELPPPPERARPERPTGGTMVPAGHGLAAAVAAAPDGAVLVLAPGEHEGPLVIERQLTLWGPPEAVVSSRGAGTTIDVKGDGVKLLGFSVAGSGRRFEDTDACVHVRGDDVVVEGMVIRQGLFGIAASGVHRTRIVGNEIVGSGERDFGLRGDAIRLWEVRDSRIEGNFVRDSRDIVVWYSPGNVIIGNYVEHGRYGTHFMYSSRNEVRGNVYLHNLVGVFVMYCDQVEVTGNLIAAADPNDGMGLGLKEAGDVVVSGNRFVRNPTGVFVDNSPIQITHENRVTGNTFEFCDTGVAFHAGVKRNTFLDNSFHGCATTVRVGGHGDATQVRWGGNYFDDYAGFDLDGDGTGDVAHEPSSLSSQLTSTRENIRFFRGTPALGLLDVVSRVLPMLAPKVLFSDASPLLRRPAPPEVPRAH